MIEMQSESMPVLVRYALVMVSVFIFASALSKGLPEQLRQSISSSVACAVCQSAVESADRVLLWPEPHRPISVVLRLTSLPEYVRVNLSKNIGTFGTQHPISVFIIGKFKAGL